MLMFDDTVFERLLDALKVDDRVVVTSHLFLEFKSNEERVALAYQLLEEEHLLPDCTITSIAKSQEDAANLRNQGNFAFQKRKDFLALRLYNQSLAVAPLYTREYALALGNRSAVNMALGFYEACLKDIGLALNSGYPRDLRLKLLERRLKCYIFLQKGLEAEQSMKDINLELKKSPVKHCNLESNMKVFVEELENLKTLIGDGSISKSEPSQSFLGSFNTPSLSYGQNKEILCASSCITLMQSEALGRHLVAGRDIAPGDVLIVEQPYASVLLPEAGWTHCYYCLKYCLSPIPCQTCTQVLFCDEECREKAWEKYHSIDCCLMPMLSQCVGKMGLLAFRILIIASSKGTELLKLFHEINMLQMSSDPRTLGFNKMGLYLSTDYWPIHFLIGHTSRRAVADLFRRSVTAACLLHCLKHHADFFSADIDEDVQYFAGGLLLHFLQSLPCNAHEVSEMSIKSGSYDSREIGAAAYATLSLLNHSCDPNVVRHSYRDWAVLRAIRPIKEGEEILDNYGYHHALHELDQRRIQLSKQYFFHCVCEACEGCWPLYKDQAVRNASYLCSFCGEVLSKENYVDIEVQCSKCESLTNIHKLEDLLKQSSTSFREHLSNILAGQPKEDILPKLLRHLELLGKSIQRPWREFSECQEAIKQCLSLQSNHIVINL